MYANIIIKKNVDNRTHQARELLKILVFFSTHIVQYAYYKRARKNLVNINLYVSSVKNAHTIQNFV